MPESIAGITEDGSGVWGVSGSEFISKYFLQLRELVITMRRVRYLKYLYLMIVIF